MKIALKLIFVALISVIFISCSNSNNRYQIVNPGSSVLQIIDTKEGIVKEYKDGRVYKIDFENNEYTTEKLKGVDLTK